MKLKIDLDMETTEALMRSAVRELRPAGLQAEVLLKRALGLTFPPKGRPKETKSQEAGTASKT
jgi:hypothetical protein